MLIVIAFCVAFVNAEKFYDLYKSNNFYERNAENFYEINNFYERSVCDQFSVGSCWITEYGIMTRDSCCFVNNSSGMLTDHEGYWDECYVTKNPNGKLYSVYDKVADGCHVYMSCHVYTPSELLQMMPKSPISSPPSIPPPSSTKPKRSVRELLVLTIFFMLFMIGGVLIVISK